MKLSAATALLLESTSCFVHGSVLPPVHPAHIERGQDQDGHDGAEADLDPDVVVHELRATSYDASYDAGFVICGFAAEGWVT
jgi:hypothetical protein